MKDYTETFDALLNLVKVLRKNNQKLIIDENYEINLATSSNDVTFCYTNGDGNGNCTYENTKEIVTPIDELCLGKLIKTSDVIMWHNDGYRFCEKKSFLKNVNTIAYMKKK